jgi:hypothetical protein
MTVLQVPSLPVLANQHRQISFSCFFFLPLLVVHAHFCFVVESWRLRDDHRCGRTLLAVSKGSLTTVATLCD